MGTIVYRGAVGALAEDLRLQGRKIVLTNGCFDLLHLGHLRCLQAARALGDVLLVGVNADEQVRRLKGEGRPFVPDIERVELVAGLTPVDFAFLFAEPTGAELIGEIRPGVYAKGGDYQTGNLPEAAAAAACGARIVLLPTIPGHSTTDLAAAVAAGRCREPAKEGLDMAEASNNLHRSERDRFVAGVCGGLAESWRVDSTLVRLGWVFFTLTLCPFILGTALYLAAWFVLPVQPQAVSGEEERQLRVAGNKQFGQVFGWLLIGIGLFYLVERLTGGLVQGFLREFRRYLWPILLIALGGALLLYRGPKGKPPEEDKP